MLAATSHLGYEGRIDGCRESLHLKQALVDSVNDVEWQVITRVMVDRIL